jgi:hypothetical protein
VAVSHSTRGVSQRSTASYGPAAAGVAVGLKWTAGLRNAAACAIRSEGKGVCTLCAMRRESCRQLVPAAALT